MKRIILLIVALMVIASAVYAVPTTTYMRLASVDKVEVIANAVASGSDWLWSYKLTPKSGSGVIGLWAWSLVLGSDSIAQIVGSPINPAGWLGSVDSTSTAINWFTMTSSLNETNSATFSFVSHWGPERLAAAGALGATTGSIGVPVLTYQGDTVGPAPVPEPATLAGLAAFLPAGFMFLKRRKN